MRRACNSGEESISFEDAARVLREELRYPEDRALNFVKRFDRNGDGRLSIAEFTQLKSKIEETYVVVVLFTSGAEVDSCSVCVSVLYSSN